MLVRCPRWSPRSLTVVVVVLWWVGVPLIARSGVRAAWAADDARAAVEQRLQKSSNGLGGNEPSAFGPRDVPLLCAVVEDREAAAALRARAVDALGLVRAAPAHAFLENLIIRKRPSSDATDQLLLRRGAIALGWQSGPRVVETLAPLLDHPAPEVRVDAAAALGLTRLQAAVAPLRAHLPGETDDAVRRQLQTQLRLLDEAAARAAGRPAPPPAR